jgi:hypothetical protein
MRLAGRIMGVCAAILLITAVVGAKDYKTWTPLLPETVAGMARSGEPDGMNMESNGNKWSMLHQRYAGNGSDKSVELTLVSGAGAPFVANFQTMSKMEMETGDRVIKTVKISNYKGLINLDKAQKRAILMIALTDETMVVMEVAPATQEKDIIAVAEDLPLEEFASKAR